MRWVAVLSIFLVGCTYRAEVQESPAYNVVSSYGNQVPGKWLLYVDASQLARPVKPSGASCSVHKFPIEIAAPFETSARQTIDNVVEEVELVSSPMSRQQISAAGARGQIVIRGEELRPRLELQPGFWSQNMAASAALVASVSVDSAKGGRILGTTVEGYGNADKGAGLACEGGAESLAEAAGVALKDVMRKIGEAITNSERMRAPGT